MGWARGGRLRGDLADRCRTLATFGTPIESYGRSTQVLQLVLLAVYRIVGMVSYLSSGIRDALLSPRTRSNDPEAVALVLDCLRAMDRRGLANAMMSISLGRPDLTPRLGAIRCPTVFVTGTDHAEWTPDQAEAKIRLVETGSVVVIPDTAYLSPLEAPTETVRIVRRLWEHHSQGRVSLAAVSEKSGWPRDDRQLLR